MLAEIIQPIERLSELYYLSAFDNQLSGKYGRSWYNLSDSYYLKISLSTPASLTPARRRRWSTSAIWS